MRTLIINMLAAALLLFGAGSAGAFSINHTTSYDGFSELEVSDTVTVHVFIDTQGAGSSAGDTGPGLSNLSVGVVFTNPNLVYTAGPNLPGSGSHTYNSLNYFYPPYNYGPYITASYNGSQSAYLLYSYPQPATGAFPGNGGGYMVAQQTPWQTWPAPPPGYGQVNLNWVPPSTYPNPPDFSQQVRASSNTWLGSIVLHVAALGPAQVAAGVFVDGTCCSVRTGDGTEHRAVTTVDAPTTINLPEPTIALLLGIGLLGLGLAGRRQD
jgi:hypothetical protein